MLVTQYIWRRRKYFCWLDNAHFELELYRMEMIWKKYQFDEVLTEIGTGASKWNTKILKQETLLLYQNCLKVPYPNTKVPFLNNCSNVTVNINNNDHPYVNKPAKEYPHIQNGFVANFLLHNLLYIVTLKQELSIYWLLWMCCNI